MIFENDAISIGESTIPELAKTSIFKNWFLSSSGSVIFEDWKRLMFKKVIFIPGHLSYPGAMAPRSARRDVEGLWGGL